MQDNLIAAIQYRDPNTKEIKILPAIPGKSAYKSAVQGGFTGDEADFNQILADLMPKTEIEEKLNAKADTVA